MNASTDGAIPLEQQDLLAALHRYIAEGHDALLAGMHAYLREKLGQQASDLLAQMVERDAAVLSKLEAMAAKQAADNARQFAVLADRREAVHGNASAWMRRLIDTSPFTGEA